MIAQVKDAKRRTRFANACRGLPVLDALLPLDCALFRKSQPWRFYAGPTLALELSGSTAWLAGHANPAELASFLSFCGCEGAILDEAVCPPPDGWHKAETLTVFGLPQGGLLPLPAVDEALWAQLSLCREAPAARVAAGALPRRLRPAGGFLLRAMHKAQPGQGSGMDAGAGKYSRLHRRCLCPVQWASLYGLRADRRAAAGQGHRRVAHCGNGKQSCRRRLAPGIPLCTGAGAVL